MAGRRSDHDKIDPGEFSAPHDVNPRDPHLTAAAKAAVAQTRVDEREELIPRRGENPALADLRARRDAARAEERGAQAHAAGGNAERADDAERTE